MAGMLECYNTLTYLTTQLNYEEAEMANVSLNRPTTVLKPTPCDSLIISLEKAKALLDVAMLADFTQSSKSTICHYVFALSEIIENALDASDKVCRKSRTEDVEVN